MVEIFGEAGKQELGGFYPCRQPQAMNNQQELQNLRACLWEAAQDLESRRWVGLAAIVL